MICPRLVLLRFLLGPEDDEKLVELVQIGGGFDDRLAVKAKGRVGLAQRRDFGHRAEPQPGGEVGPESAGDDELAEADLRILR